MDLAPLSDMVELGSPAMQSQPDVTMTEEGDPNEAADDIVMATQTQPSGSDACEWIRDPANRDAVNASMRRVARLPNKVSREKNDQDLHWRTLFIKAISSNIVELEPCALSSLLRLESLRDSLVPGNDRSASDTLVVLGRLRYHVAKPMQLSAELANTAPAVVAKISFAPLRPPTRVKSGAFYVDQLVFEADVYEKVTNPLLLGGHTPHLIAWYGTFRCSNVRHMLEDATLDDKSDDSVARMVLACDLRTTMSRIETEMEGAGKYDFDKMQVLLLERGLGKSLAATELNKVSPELQASVIAQTLYTLATFGEVGLRHNDLHPGNVWLQPCGLRPSSNIYFITETQYLIVPTYGTLVKIYDFDLATTYPGSQALSAMDPKQRNRTPRDFPLYCKQYGICNHARNAKFDCYQFLSSLYWTTAGVAAAVKEQIRRAAGPSSNSYLNLHPTSWPYDAHVCKIVRGTESSMKRTCDGNYEPTDNEWPSTLSFLVSIAAANDWLYDTKMDGFPPQFTPALGFDEIYRLPSVPKSAVSAHRLERLAKLRS